MMPEPLSIGPGRNAGGAAGAGPAPPRQPTDVVLDTNVVFDGWLFADPACMPLRAAIERGGVRWIATPAMFDECFHVIGRGSLDAWAPNPTAMRATWAEHCTIVSPPPAGATHPAPRCSDADDQMFIDLAIARRTPWLLSKDGAVLRLAARLALFGVRAVSPAAWARLQTVSGEGSLETAPDRPRRGGRMPDRPAPVGCQPPPSNVAQHEGEPAPERFCRGIGP